MADGYLNENARRRFDTNMKQKKLQIAVVNRYFYPVTAGIETNLMEIYPTLQRHNWNVTVHVTNNTLERKNVLRKSEMIKGVRVKRYKSGMLGFFPKIQWSKIDILSIQNFTLSPHLYIFFYVLVLKILNKKHFSFILSTHGGFTPDWPTFSPPQRIIKGFLHKYLGRWFINLTTDDIRAVSEWEKNELIKSGINPSLISIIGNGIEKEAFTHVSSKKIRSQVKSYGKYLIQISRIHRTKNIETTIKALPYLPKEIKFVIVGPTEDHKYKAELEILIKKLQLEKRVIFTGVINGSDKYYLIKHSQMMVHMALWEAYANVILEGMSQGKVCIVSDIPSLAAIVHNGIHGYRIPKRNSKALSKQILYVLQEKNGRIISSIERTNYYFARQRSWTNIVEVIERYYLDSLRRVQLGSKQLGREVHI